MSAASTEPEKAIGFPGDGVTGSCELHKTGTEVQTGLLCKCSEY